MSRKTEMDCAQTDMFQPLFIGVDVGTSSARAALVNKSGKVLKQYERAIKTWNPQKDQYEQSSDDIWFAVSYCVKMVTSDSMKHLIKGISFDATCSLVVLDTNRRPITVSTTGKNEQNVILWMDHRAHQEADFINDTGDDILRYVGGQVSVEMELPKLLWLKRNIPSTYQNIGLALDLADYLTMRACGLEIRSSCTVVCKWNYDAQNNSWKRSFFDEIGLSELCDNNFSKIGNNIMNPGQKISNRLTKIAANDFDLMTEINVGLGIIDAHAGALAMFGCRDENDFGDNHCEIESKLALISGTSTCHMSMTRTPNEAPGVWGPYKNVIFPNYYLNEAGQSATGVLLDTYLVSHPQYSQLLKRFGDKTHIYSHLNDLLVRMAAEKNLTDIGLLTKDLHVWPDFHGNRSPIADPKLKGMISGLTLNTDEESLALVYLALIQGLAYGTRHIIERLEEQRESRFRTLLFCGGVSKNSVYVKCHADICGLSALIPNEREKVLIGSAILAAYASDEFSSLEEAALHMGGTGKLVPATHKMKMYHDLKYKVFLKMLEDQRSYEALMRTDGM